MASSSDSSVSLQSDTVSTGTPVTTVVASTKSKRATSRKPSKSTSSTIPETSTPKEASPPTSTQFPPGVSGNPRGRPKGAKNRVTLLKVALEEELRERASTRMPQILEKAIELALNGDRMMIKLLLDMHVSKSQHSEDESDGKGRVQVLIQNTTAQPAKAVVVKPADIIDAEVVNETKVK